MNLGIFGSPVQTWVLGLGRHWFLLAVATLEPVLCKITSYRTAATVLTPFLLAVGYLLRTNQPWKNIEHAIKSACSTTVRVWGRRLAVLSLRSSLIQTQICGLLPFVHAFAGLTVSDAWLFGWVGCRFLLRTDMNQDDGHLGLDQTRPKPRDPKPRNPKLAMSSAVPKSNSVAASTRSTWVLADSGPCGLRLQAVRYAESPSGLRFQVEFWVRFLYVWCPRSPGSPNEIPAGAQQHKPLTNL